MGKVICNKATKTKCNVCRHQEPHRPCKTSGLDGGKAVICNKHEGRCDRGIVICKEVK